MPLKAGSLRIMSAMDWFVALATQRTKGLRGQDLNLRPSGYEPDELPGCSTPRQSADNRPAPQKTKAASRPLRKEVVSALRRPGGDLLSQVLRHSTIGAKAFDGRVRDGIGSKHLAKATRPAKGRNEAKLEFSS